MKTVPKTFGELVFDDRVMKARLPLQVYHSMKNTIDGGHHLDSTIADAVAGAMKECEIGKMQVLLCYCRKTAGNKQNCFQKRQNCIFPNPSEVL